MKRWALIFFDLKVKHYYLRADFDEEGRSWDLKA